MTFTGKDLVNWGYVPGSHFKEAIAAANNALRSGASEAGIRAAIDATLPPPTIPLKESGTYHRNIEAEDGPEADNVAKVDETMAELMRTPTIMAGAVMPDACPAGPVGTIPVGGVVACKNAIHPGFHSADICCSMAMTVLGDVDPTRVLDLGMQLSHFGGGGRPRGKQIQPPTGLLERFAANDFLKDIASYAIEHFATQGDGNHFFYVGRIRSTGDVAIVTHHGSRKPGAMLYKRGMQAAQRYTVKASPETLKGNAWIPADSAEGEAYWEALQIIREWTKANHYEIHFQICNALGVMPRGRVWNEHNFVFRRNGLYYHGKGATPAWEDYAADSTGLTLIPLNMAEPILITRGLDAANGLGFSPHGAGRNWSRSAHMRALGEHEPSEVIERETRGLDVRFFSGVPDMSELPSAYKNAEAVRSQIDSFGLAEVVDQVDPIGTIMAGDWLKPFRQKKG